MGHHIRSISNSIHVDFEPFVRGLVRICVFCMCVYYLSASPSTFHHRQSIDGRGLSIITRALTHPAWTRPMTCGHSAIGSYICVELSHSYLLSCGGKPPVPENYPPITRPKDNTWWQAPFRFGSEVVSHQPTDRPTYLTFETMGSNYRPD